MEEDIRFRSLSGFAWLVWTGLLLATPLLGLVFVLNLPTSFGFLFYGEQYTGLFFGIVYALCFLGTPAHAGAPRDRVPWYDWLLAVIGLVTGLYITLNYPRIAETLGWVTTDRVVLGTMFVLITLEALRRVTSAVLVVVVLVFLAYAYVAPYMPGPLNGSSTKFSDFVNYIYLDGNNGLGLIRIAATIGLAFILFGQVLTAFSGSDLINKIVISAFGRYRGGPAKAAVAGSSLVGTVTGGAATNVMLTGVVTIPMMVRTGYRPEYAGAVESVASTGGQIMPPVMGIAAFLIADNLGIPYTEVALAAVVPALLYYVGVFLQVDLAAARDGLAGVRQQDLPSMRGALARGWPIFPIFGLLIYLILVRGYEPSSAGVYGAAAGLVFLVAALPDRRDVLLRLFRCLVETTKSIIAITVVLAAAGLIVGVTNITGLGFNMALALSHLGSHSLGLLLAASAIVCIVLGMGMPTVAAYTLVAILVAPAMVDLGAPPLAAHLFILFFAVVSNFTPPVAIACYAASAIARVDATRIAWASMRLGVAAYLVPFLFVLSPTLILQGGVVAVTISVTTAIAGMALLAAGIEAYCLSPLALWQRVLAGVSGLMLLVPLHQGLELVGLINALGLLGGIFILVDSWRRNPARASGPV